MPRPSIADTNLREQQLLQTLSKSGYTHVRRLGNTYVGLLKFSYTVGLVIGLDAIGYERRYCYEHADDAIRALDQWNGAEHPGGPWIKCKGAGVDLLNPNFGSDLV
jgi:hypothetical protein